MDKYILGMLYEKCCFDVRVKLALVCKFWRDIFVKSVSTEIIRHRNGRIYIRTTNYNGKCRKEEMFYKNGNLRSLFIFNLNGCGNQTGYLRAPCIVMRKNGSVHMKIERMKIWNVVYYNAEIEDKIYEFTIYQKPYNISCDGTTKNRLIIRNTENTKYEKHIIMDNVNIYRELRRIREQLLDYRKHQLRPFYLIYRYKIKKAVPMMIFLT